MKTKVWLFIAALLVLIGGILFACVMSSLGWDFTRLSTVKYVTNTYQIEEEFNGICMNTDTADIIFALSDDGRCRVECYEKANEEHSVSVKDGALTVESIDEKTFYDYICSIGIGFASTKITVYLPKTEYDSLVISEDTGDIEIPKNFKFGNVDISASTGDVRFYASTAEAVKIETSTGDINLTGVSAGLMKLLVSTGKVTVYGVSCEGDITVNVSTGRVYFTDIACQSLTSDGNTGDIFLENVIAEEKFSIERDTGDVMLTDCDAAEIFIETDTGDVRGTLLSDKVFITKTDTGRISVPNSVTGGRCEITTDTGDIQITVK